MTKRERIEDLGKIAVMAHQACNHEIFSLYSGRKKDIWEWFSSLTKEQKSDFLYKVAYGLDEVGTMLGDIWCLAHGEEE